MTDMTWGVGMDEKYVQLTQFFLIEEKVDVTKLCGSLATGIFQREQMKDYIFACRIKNQYDIELILKVNADRFEVNKIKNIQILNKDEAKKKFIYLKDDPVSPEVEDLIIQGLSMMGVKFLNYAT